MMPTMNFFPPELNKPRNWTMWGWCKPLKKKGEKKKKWEHINQPTIKTHVKRMISIRRLFHFFQCNWGAIPFKEKKKQRQTSEAKKKNHRKERELQSPAHTSPKLPVFSTIMKKKEQEFSMTKSIIQEFTFPNFLQDLNIWQVRNHWETSSVGLAFHDDTDRTPCPCRKRRNGKFTERNNFRSSYCSEKKKALSSFFGAGKLPKWPRPDGFWSFRKKWLPQWGLPEKKRAHRNLF